MGPRSYLAIVRQCESYLDQYGDSPCGVGWFKEGSADAQYQVILDAIREPESGRLSLLDFGCGAAHFLDYLERHEVEGIEYTGLDISPAFLALCREKHPGRNFLQQDVLLDASGLPLYDYVIANGIFTQKCELAFDEMWDYMQRLLRVLWKHANKGLVFNNMSEHVDWQREDLFHLPFDTLASFLTAEFTRDFVFRSDYGCYDYMTYMYR